MEGVPTEALIQKADFEIFENFPKSPCWKCSDTPCIKIRELVAPGTMLIKGSNLLDYNICPTKSVSQDKSGELLVDKDTCTGCGLCVVACPVNSLVLNAEMLPITRYSELENVGDHFVQTRMEVGKSIQKVAQELTAPIVHWALTSTSRLLEEDIDGKSAQLFVRNVFLNSGFKTRIPIGGDTNDAFELVAESSDSAFPIEIAVGGDTLDSTRRILSGCASLISKGTVDVFNLRPILVVDELPNTRSDIYRVIDDMHKYLGLDLKIIPLYILQLLTFLEINLEDYFTSSGNYPASEWYWQNLRDIGNAKDSDLEALKLTK